METLRTELEAQHQASVQELKALWAEEQQAELQLQLDAQVASAKAAWDQELHKVPSTSSTGSFVLFVPELKVLF